jgi:diaminopimelate epimerase
MCGNGVRCVAKYAFDHGLASGLSLGIETDAGVKYADCKVVDGTVVTVRVDMASPSLDAATLPSTLDEDRIVDYPLEVAGSVFAVTCVSMGNPHAVVFVEELEAIALDRLGPQFEHADVFPQRINTHFVRVDSPRQVTVKTWERGSGATSACGTGACAVCVAGAITHRTERTITASMPGGDLHLEWAADDHVYMTGPAVEVFTGVW